jgi:glycolate oxidase FAD binding subunit
VGVLLVRLSGDPEAQAQIITELRARAPAARSSTVVLRGVSELKRLVDVWGPIGDALPLMRAVKQQFDPRGILNPDRGPGGV